MIATQQIQCFRMADFQGPQIQNALYIIKQKKRKESRKMIIELQQYCIEKID